MSLEPYKYRPVTPENFQCPSPTHESGHSRNSSAKFSIWSSPDSPQTQATTPSHSPTKAHHGSSGSSTKVQQGRDLLPKIRTQDQALEPDVRPSSAHRRAFSTNYNPPAHPAPSRPAFQRSTTSPPECYVVATPTPISAALPADIWAENSAINSSTPISASYGSRGFRHCRSTSTPAVDFATLRRVGNPNYRTLPVYTTQAPQYPSALSPHYSNVLLPPLQTYDSAEATLPPADPCHQLDPELCQLGPTTTLMDYLTEPNPAVKLVDRITTGSGLQTHFWWDIRNLRVWEDFTVSTIRSIPRFTTSTEGWGLLSVPVPATCLPKTPSEITLRPATERTLLEIITKHYASKINKALEISQGAARHCIMRAEHTPENGGAFISAYANDATQTLSGNGKGRLVGLVKPFELWNTALKSGNAVKRTLYYAGLAHLHRLMREHGCRYGYIITEIELVCVRLGTETTPYFGLMELSAPIELSTNGTEGELTASLALWYLHMLTSDFPLPGQCGYRVDIGPPGTAREKFLDKDVGMHEPQRGETRHAKTRRGWVWPGDPYSAKERKLARAGSAR